MCANDEILTIVNIIFVTICKEGIAVKFPLGTIKSLAGPIYIYMRDKFFLSRFFMRENFFFRQGVLIYFSDFWYVSVVVRVNFPVLCVPHNVSLGDLGGGNSF